MAGKIKKMRIDRLLVDLRLAADIGRSRALIMSGSVIVDDVPVTKAGQQVDSGADVRLRGQEHPYVSRGGLKLAHALKEFGCDVRSKICMDVGASTGGFTDCLLQNGAVKVYAIDVGYGQLAAKLASDERVVIIDRTNIRTIDPHLIPQAVDIVTIDVSFISLSMIFPAVKRFVSEGSTIIALVKPQFEVEKERVDEGGIVTDPALHREAVERVATDGEKIGWKRIGLTESPISGAKGNKEFLLCFMAMR